MGVKWEHRISIRGCAWLFFDFQINEIYKKQIKVQQRGMRDTGKII